MQRWGCEGKIASPGTHSLTLKSLSQSLCQAAERQLINRQETTKILRLRVGNIIACWQMAVTVHL